MLYPPPASPVSPSAQRHQKPEPNRPTNAPGEASRQPVCPLQDEERTAPRVDNKQLVYKSPADRYVEPSSRKCHPWVCLGGELPR
ncbi:hypothetical protein CC78DRAFT_611338 [Lojkania enalia]|uniref:Uncharacterized protein n=1 Tax=Lojkania enalia TaxID=147567 RepID=A0A9P4NC44_9PLEO|nr:hypothetical protein CC78DRAFT_611338 [Didymosphaeria enalia]